MNWCPVGRGTRPQQGLIFAHLLRMMLSLLTVLRRFAKTALFRRSGVERKNVLLLLLTTLSAIAAAQTSQENSGWLAWFNSARIKGAWSLHLDVQARSADQLEYMKNLLVRPGITYAVNKNNLVTTGYGYIATYIPAGAEPGSTMTEHRVWEQYILNLEKIPLQNRFRLEQRFIERPVERVFSQRLRYFLRSVVPLRKNEGPFSKGIFVALQNEVFVNVQNKEKINNSLFDQNRAYLAVGYRLSKQLDIETGYLNQFIKGKSSDVSNHVIQLAVYTRF